MQSTTGGTIVSYSEDSNGWRSQPRVFPAIVDASDRGTPPPRRRPVGLINLIKEGTAVYSMRRRTVNASCYTDLGTVVYNAGLPDQKAVHSWAYYALTEDAGLTLSGGYERVWDADHSRELVNQLLSKARGSSVNLANMLAEYKQTTQLYAENTLKLVAMLSWLARKHPEIRDRRYYPGGSRWRGLTRRRQKQLANAHLEFVYGAVPLASDIHDSMEALKNRAAGGPPMVMKIRAGITERGSSSWTSRGGFSGKTVRHSCNFSQKSRAHGFVMFDNEALNRSLGQYGFTNPLAVVWEKLKWSFVVDWFVNVGEVIQSLDNALYISGGYYQISSTRRYDGRASVGGGEGSYMEVQSSRGAPMVLPLTANFCLKRNPLSVRHVANALALLRQAVR